MLVRQFKFSALWVFVVCSFSSSSFAAPTPVTFGTPTPLTVPGINQPTVVDLDGDGHLDIVAPTTAGFTVFYGKGDGTFTEVDYPIPLGTPAVFADFNGDGHLDIATSYTNSVGIIYNTGTRTFAQPVTVATGTKIYGLCTGDFNEDKLPDLATADNGTGQVGVILNQGHETFGTPTYYNVGGFLKDIETAKLTTSGHLDLIVGIHYSPTAAILFGDGLGNFPTTGSAAGGGGVLVCADFNNDGFTDIAGCDYWSDGLGVALNNGTGGFTQSHSYTTEQYPSGIYAEDLNADGSLDLTVGQQGTGDFSVWLNDGTGNFTLQGEITTPGATDVHDPVLGDFNEDGLPDVVVDGEPNTLNLYLNSTNVTPVSTSLLPAYAYVGESAYNFDVVGTGFLKRSVIEWNGSPLPTTYISSSLLSAVVPASLLLVPAQVPIRVVTSSPGGGTSAALTFTVSYPDPSLTSVSPETVSQGTSGQFLTLTGSNFAPGDSVIYNGVSGALYPTTYVDSTTLTTAIPAAVTNSVQTVSIAVSAPTTYGGGGVSNAISLSISKITYPGGINFFSTPFAYSDTLSNIFSTEPDPTLLYLWNPLSFTYGTQGDPNPVKIALGRGYWADFPSGGSSLNYIGSPASTASDYTIPLQAGWNSIGDPETVSVNVSNLTFTSTDLTFAAASSGNSPLISPILYNFQQASGGTTGTYAPVTSAGTITPGLGYWIYAFADTTLNFPLPATLPAAAPVQTTVSPVNGTGGGTTAGSGKTFYKRHHL